MRMRSESRTQYGRVFGLAAGTAFLLFLPFLIYDSGIFTFLGDFNVQQIPFYQLANRALKSGEYFWNWHLDLGTNFIASFSFYLLGSPFFWLSVPFPAEWTPYLMAPLLCIKMGVMAAGGYGFIKRFVVNQRYAVLGGLLYALSGFSVYNIFFNHFHDVMALFPFLLIALEEAMVNGRKGVFAFAVCLNAMVNYVFFVGEVVFVILYFVVRMLTREIRLTPGKFCSLAFESVIGFAMSAVLLLPSILMILGNPRIDNLMDGWDLLLYWEPQRYPAILQAFLFPPDLPSRPNFFPDAGVKWMSVAGFLPVMSIAGAVAFVRSKKGHWAKRMVVICTVIAFVPGLQAFFYLMNASTYSRWYYMFTLMLALVSVKALEDSDVDLETGFKYTLRATLIMALAVGLAPTFEEEGVTIGLAQEPGLLWLYTAIAVVSLGALAYILQLRRQGRSIFRAGICLICAITLLYGWTYLAWGKLVSNDSKFIINQGIHGAEHLDLPDDTFYRVDVYEGMDNQAMFWNLPNIQTFHSVVPGSIMEFFPAVGVTRDVGSRPEPEYYGLRGLLSVRYLFVDERKGVDPEMPGFVFWDNQNGFDIYENEYFVPMGFTYDYYVTEEDFYDTSEYSREFLLMRAVMLSDEQIARYGDILEEIPRRLRSNFSESAYLADCEDRAASACYAFTADGDRFTARINLERDNLVFFTVPYESGWSATVNGEPVTVEKVSAGMMAVRVPAGDNLIEFSYVTPGLHAGLLITIGAALLLAVYILVNLVLKRMGHGGGEPDPGFDPDAVRAGNPFDMSADRAVLPAAPPDPIDPPANEAAAEAPPEPTPAPRPELRLEGLMVDDEPVELAREDGNPEGEQGEERR